MNLESIKKLLATPQGKALKDYLLSELRTLNSIESVKALNDPVQLSIEVKAQGKAYEALMHILEPLLDTGELPTLKQKGHELIPE
jgi:hypothetical protein